MTWRGLFRLLVCTGLACSVVANSYWEGFRETSDFFSPFFMTPEMAPPEWMLAVALGALLFACGGLLTFRRSVLREIVKKQQRDGEAS